jgi:hypothetical protein
MFQQILPNAKLYMSHDQRCLPIDQPNSKNKNTPQKKRGEKDVIGRKKRVSLCFLFLKELLSL